MNKESDKNFEWFIGIDEVGRGPLAGPITICAMAFQARALKIFNGIKDSKQLAPVSRKEWSKKIHKEKRAGNISFAVCSSSNKVIDKIGLSKAIKLAIKNSLKKLNIDPKNCLVLLDGSLKAPKEYIYQETIIRGDEKEQIITAASVVAKVKRDRLMETYAVKFPGYGLEKHKGYGTRDHYEAINKHGISEIHRKCFLKNISW